MKHFLIKLPALVAAIGVIYGLSALAAPVASTPSLPAPVAAVSLPLNALALAWTETHQTTGFTMNGRPVALMNSGR